MPFCQDLHMQSGKTLLSSSGQDASCLSLPDTTPHIKYSSLWIKILVHLSGVVFSMADLLKHWCNLLVSCDYSNAAEKCMYMSIHSSYDIRWSVLDSFLIYQLDQHVCCPYTLSKTLLLIRCEQGLPSSVHLCHHSYISIWNNTGFHS